MTRQTIVNINDENINEVTAHAVRTLNQMIQALQALKSDINHAEKWRKYGAIVITAAIAPAMQDAINQATNELKGEQVH